MENLTIQKIIGNIGERFVAIYLSKNSDSFVRADKIDFLAHHLLLPDSASPFDIENLSDITAKCRNGKFCRIAESERPCRKKEFYKPNPDATPAIDLPNTGDNKIRWYCAVRITKTCLDDYKSYQTTPQNKFISDYLICHYYIENLYQQKLKAAPFNTLSKEEKKQFLSYWNGHPERLDFFAKINNQFHCIDAKVNSSGLSLWQQTRMAWMTKCGHTAQIFHVKFQYDKTALNDTYCNEGVDAALATVSPEQNVIDFATSEFPDAEKLVSDTAQLITVAQSKFRWLGFDPVYNSSD